MQPSSSPLCAALRLPKALLRAVPLDAHVARLSSSSLHAQPAGALSVRQRLKQTSLDPEVLEMVLSLGVAMPERRRGRSRGEQPATLLNHLVGRREMRKMGFVASAVNMETLPPAALSEVAVAGRSNVGKSSLLNALIGKTCGPTGSLGVAQVRNLPGVTRSVNFYAAGKEGPTLVDLPGYGYAVRTRLKLEHSGIAMRI